MTMVNRTYRWFLMALFLVLGLTSCAYFGGGKGAPSATPSVAQPASPPLVQPTAADREAELRAIIAKHIDAANRAGENPKADVIRRTPYFFRQYDIYPKGSDAFTVTMQEREKRSVPYAADVSIPAQRFITRFHRERAEAEADTGFLRETGKETIVYEFRNGNWTRAGSIFVADKTEEKVDGTWAPVKAAVKRTIPAEEENAKKGFFGRIWSKIAG